MCSPCQSDKNRLQKIESDVESMLLLQEATKPHGVNCKLICAHSNEDFKVEILQESYEDIEPKRERCTDGNHQETRYGTSSEGVLIKLAYNPKRKPSCKIIGPCSKHSTSMPPCKEYSQMDNSSKHKVIRAGRLDTVENEKRLQEIRCLRTKLKETEEALKIERAANNEVEIVKNEHERLKKENCRLKNDIAHINKAKTDSPEILRKLSCLTDERNELRSLVDDQTDIITNLKKKCCKLKTENKKMHQEGESKIQDLLSENLDLSNKVKDLDSTLNCMRKEFQAKEKCNDEITEQEVAGKLNDQGNMENELQCLRKSFSEKENMLKISNEQLKLLKSELCKAKEANDRSILSQDELENSLNELKKKLMDSEAALKNTQHELCLLKKDSEIKEGCLRSKLEAKENEIAGLMHTNSCLEEKLQYQSTHNESKEHLCESWKDRSYNMSVQMGNFQECMAENEKKRCAEADQQTVNCENEGGSNLCALKEELERTREALEQERLESEKKCKLINELHGDIKHIKENESCKLRELQIALKEKEQSERSMKFSFCQERRQNEKLLDELTKLKWQEKELSQQLAETHAQLVQHESSMSIENECTEHSRMLEQIEHEVETKTVEWQEYIKKVTDERDNAIRAAKFASQKLMTSVADFQRHVAIQRKVQQMLTELLYQRESELKNAAWKISKLKADALNNVHNALLIRKNSSVKSHHSCEGTFKYRKHKIM